MNGEADLVIGSRLTDDDKEENKKKMLSSRLFWAKVLNFVANPGAKVKVSDSQSGLRSNNEHDYSCDACT